MSAAREPSRMVESEGVRLAVYETGEPGRETVLLVHGYPDTHSVWDGVVEILAARFHVVTYDVRGAGNSSAPRATNAYRMGLLAADLFAVADAVSPDMPVHVVAHDWGSIQSWEAVTETGADTRIASFTSISGPCLDHVGHLMRRRLSRPTPRNLGKVLHQLAHSWYVAVFHLPMVAPAVWTLWLARRWGGVLAKLEDVPSVPGHPAPTLRSDAVRGIALYRANMLGRLGHGARRRSTSIPVQLIQPTGDHYVTESLTEDVQRWAPRLWRRRLAAKHWAPLTHPQAVARMATELIEHTSGRATSRGLRRAQVADRRSPFADRLAVITGAGSGIGRATALAFAEAGADVVLSDIDGDAVRSTAELAAGLGVQAHGYQVDVADGDAVRRFATEVAAEHGVPDILVNNAGIGHAGSVLDTTTPDWERVLDVNLWGVIHGCKAFGELMVEAAEGGHIVNVSSAAAFLPSKMLSAYATSKAAVFTLSDCLRAELAGQGVGVSTICPGFVSTNITNTATFAGLSEAEQARKQARATSLYARRGFGPEKVARNVVRAVEQDQAVVPVTVEAKAFRLLSRVSPATLRAMAKLEPV